MEIQNLLRLGFAIFPLWSNQKTPATENGCKNATTSETEFNLLCKDRRLLNVGVEAYRSGVIIVDIDTKDGRDGSLFFIQNGGEPLTLTATTPSGGRHYYFRRPEGLTADSLKGWNSKDELGSGVEIKAFNSYCVAPPSCINGNFYRWDNSNAIAPLPNWLETLIRNNAKKYEKPQLPQTQTFLPCSPEETITGWYNSHTSIEEALTAAGYSYHGGKWAYPGEKTPSVVIYGSGSYHFGAGDPMRGKGRGRENSWCTAYDLYVERTHGGNHGSAYRAIREMMPKQERPNIVNEIDAELSELLKQKVTPDDPDLKHYELRKFKGGDRFPKGVKAIADCITNIIRKPLHMQSMVAAITLIAGAVGKRVRFYNEGRTYYPNLATAILTRSGGSKSNFHGVTFNLLKEVTDAVDNPATSTMEAFIGFRGDVINEKDKTKRETAIRDSIEQQKLNPDGHTIIVDEFRPYVLTMVPPQESIKNGQLFCRIVESGDTAKTETMTQGVRILADACITMLGITQADAWNVEMGTPAFKSGGLWARFLPVNSGQICLDPYIPSSATFADALTSLRSIRDFAESCGTIEVYFGNEPDLLGRMKKEFAAEVADVGFFIKNSPRDWEILENKILIQAAKVASLLAVADEVDKQMQSGSMQFEPRKSIDASPWLALAYSLVGLCHITNTYHVAEINEQTENMDRIKTVIKRKGKEGTTAAYIVKRTNFRQRDVTDLLRLMIEDGEVVETTSKGGRTKIYKLK